MTRGTGTRIIWPLQSSPVSGNPESGKLAAWDLGSGGCDRRVGMRGDELMGPSARKGGWVEAATRRFIALFSQRYLHSDSRPWTGGRCFF